MNEWIKDKTHIIYNEFSFFTANKMTHCKPSPAQYNSFNTKCLLKASIYFYVRV